MRYAMDGVRLRLGVWALASSLTLAGASALSAQERGLGAAYNAEITFVFTSGNARANTFGAAAGFRYVWERTELSLRASGLRTETGIISRTAVGTAGDFEVVEETDTELTAENYAVRARVDRTLSARTFVFWGAGWERNTFAGFDSRVSGVTGLGIAWADNDRTRFKTDVGLTYTKQDDVIDDPAKGDTFAGLRAAWDFSHELSATTTLQSALVIDENLNETEDLRADLTNAVVIDISEALAFKTSFQILYDNLPSLTTIPLQGTTTTVQAPLDEVDTALTIALVASF